MTNLWKSMQCCVDSSFIIKIDDENQEKTTEINDNQRKSTQRYVLLVFYNQRSMTKIYENQRTIYGNQCNFAFDLYFVVKIR